MFRRKIVFFYLIFFLLAGFYANSIFAEQHIKEAIVKVYAVYDSPSYYNPWSMTGPRTKTGSGAIISGDLILTNAHIVSDVTFLQVRRYGDTQRYQADVYAVLHQSDLALLKVDDKTFFESVTPLELGELPETHLEVAVYGFPLGGDTLSITKGIVSRIEHQPYIHSLSFLLAGQIDAAINPGNSGGPVIVDGKIVGVTMQSIPLAQNIGYMVPAPVIEHFLENVERGKIRGFPTLGVTLQKMENKDLRQYYKMSSEQTGMLVTSVFPGSSADGIIKAGDILLAIDNYQIANDGTVEFRANERTWLSYVVQKRQIGEKVNAQILRDGALLSFDIVLSSSIEDHRLVPMEQYDTLPTYYIFGGFVFSPLSKDLLKIWGESWYDTAPKELVSIYQKNIPEVEGEQVVLISRVLAAEINDGYQDISFWIIHKVNGIRIKNMEELVSLIEEGTNPYTILENKEGQKIILNNERARADNEQILSIYRIHSDRSDDLKQQTFSQ